MSMSMTLYCTDSGLSTPTIMNGWHETEIRVRYAETDQMGIVHHANYLIWFEAGRSDLCRARGFSYKEMEDEGRSPHGRRRVIRPLQIAGLLRRRAYDQNDHQRRSQPLDQVQLRGPSRVGRALLAEGETLHLVTGKRSKGEDRFRRSLQAFALTDRLADTRISSLEQGPR